jgi:hypothetical protein
MRKSPKGDALPGVALRRRSEVWPSCFKPPHRRVPVARGSVCPLISITKQKDGWNSERYRDDTLANIALIHVLMQRKPCAGLVAINQTGTTHGRALCKPDK